MYSLLSKSRSLNLPIDIQIDLFDKLVVPILLSGCEMYGFENIEIIERLYVKYLKYILGLKTSTPTYMVYGETGCFPLNIQIKCKIVSFWTRILCSHQEKLSYVMYNCLFKKYGENISISRWLHFIKNILDNCGLSNIWYSQSFPSTKCLTAHIKLILQDQYRQEWAASINNSSKGYIYRCFKHDLTYETYLSKLPQYYRRIFLEFKTTSHKLPVEKGRFSNLPREARTCDQCNNNKLGDEIHFLLGCPVLNQLREKYIPKL